MQRKLVALILILAALAAALTFTTATPAPTLTRPIEAPIAYVLTLRSDRALTTRPPPAWLITAPVSMWAFWVLESLMTAT